MIAAGIVWGDNPRFDLSRLSFGDAAAARGDETLSRMGDSAVLLRHPPRQAHGKTARTPSGTIVAFNGWIDNADEISRELSLPADSNVAALYGAATEAWGIAAERRIVGDYAAIIIPADGVMRLSRAPWSKHGLFYTLANSCAVAASVPRVLFGLGLERSVDPARYAELLYGLAPSWGAQTYFDEVSQVEQGSVVTIDRGSVQKVQWYDPHALSATRLARDEDYVEQANALLADSVRHALGPASFCRADSIRRLSLPKFSTSCRKGAGSRALRSCRCRKATSLSCPRISIRTGQRSRHSPRYIRRSIRSSSTIAASLSGTCWTILFAQATQPIHR